MRKKIIILIIVILLLSAGGVFWWYKQGEGIKGSIEDFSIKETLEGKIVENKREGLSFKVPKGWEVEKTESIGFFSWGVKLFSPDVKFSANNPLVLEKGCETEVGVEIAQLNFEVVNLYLNEFQGKPITLEKDGYEVIEIAHHQALGELIYEDPKIGKQIEVRIPVKNNKNIYFVILSSWEDKERCAQEFDKFLETVSID